MRRNSRSLAGGWATEGRRSGPEATTRRGGRDTQDGWLDCRGESALFHKNNNHLSHDPDSSAKRKISRPAPTPRIGARQPNHQSIDSDKSDPIKPKIVRGAPETHHEPHPASLHPTSPSKIATQLHPPQTLPLPPSCAPIATHRPASFSVFSLITPAFLTDDLKTPI